METFGELIRGDKPVLVDFYADWCGPCKAMEPTVKEVAKLMEGKARVIKINIDANQQVASAFGVNAVPTFILFRKGEILWRHPGMIDKASLKETIERFTKTENA